MRNSVSMSQGKINITIIEYGFFLDKGKSDNCGSVCYKTGVIKIIDTGDNGYIEDLGLTNMLFGITYIVINRTKN